MICDSHPLEISSLTFQRQFVTMQGDLVPGEQAIQIPAGQINISADGTLSVNVVLVSNKRFDREVDSWASA